MGLSKTFCPLPWTRMAISALGTIRLCCHTTPEIGLARNTDGSFCNMPTDLEAAWNTPLFKEVRSAMKKGKWHPSCSTCQKREENHEYSPRQQMLEQHPGMSDENVSVEVKRDQIRGIDLRLGNKCNLKCRMCSPFSSSAWHKDWSQLGQLVQTIEIAEQERMDDTWYEHEQTWNELKALIPYLSEVLLTGGEPLLIEGNKGFLRACIAKGRASEINLDYNTNGTVIDNELFDLWKEFSQVTIKISLDGVGPLNDYIRYPSRWSKIMENLAIYKKISAESRISLSIYCTVQAYNIFQVPEIRSFFDELGIHVHFNMLLDPQYLSISVLPPFLATKAKVQIEMMPDFHEKEALIQVLNSPQSNYWQAFCEYTKRLDRARGHSMTQYIPELTIAYLNILPTIEALVDFALTKS
jgi:sulfatase maturation enzyme AslB (radical SAM superfamily)